MSVSLDRFSAPLTRERRRWQIQSEAVEVSPECVCCGEPAFYKLQGLKDEYCLHCIREVAEEMNLDLEIEMELI